MIDASHRRNGGVTATLQGQNGLDFIKNIIGNLILDKNYKTDQRISLIYPSEKTMTTNSTENLTTKMFTIEGFLENCKIPFLTNL